MNLLVANDLLDFLLVVGLFTLGWWALADAMDRLIGRILNEKSWRAR